MMSLRTSTAKSSGGSSSVSAVSSPVPPSSGGRRGRRPGGHLPVASEDTSMARVLALVAMRLVRRLFLPRAELKALVYLVAVVVVSLVVDTLPPAVAPPSSYFARKHNVLNVVFVKWGWAWTLLGTGALATLTGALAGGGQWARVRGHWLRLAAATLLWYVVVALFVRVERSVGVCRLVRRGAAVQPRVGRDVCLGAGGVWRGFDISGHSFLLVFCGLLIVEEVGAIDGWDRVVDWIRAEGHVRGQPDPSAPSSLPAVTPLHHLSASEFEYVRECYPRYNRLVCAVFMLLVVLAALWDTMLMATAVYFHTPLQKTIGGAVGVCAWWLLYRARISSRLLLRPGSGGLFCYSSTQVAPPVSSQQGARAGRRNSLSSLASVSARSMEADEVYRSVEQSPTVLKNRSVGSSR